MVNSRSGSLGARVSWSGFRVFCPGCEQEDGRTFDVTNARESRSLFFRPLPPATVKKVLLWAGLFLWLVISLFFLLRFLGVDVKKAWKSEPVLSGAAALLLFLLRSVAVGDAPRRRRPKDESSPGSSSPIDPV
jgi:hypothetical protein